LRDTWRAQIYHAGPVGARRLLLPWPLPPIVGIAVQTHCEFHGFGGYSDGAPAILRGRWNAVAGICARPK
jgi:hypothetical protein